MARRGYKTDIDLFRRVEKLAAKHIDVSFEIRLPAIDDPEGNEVFPERDIAVKVKDGLVHARGLLDQHIPLVLLMAREQPWRGVESFGKIVYGGKPLLYEDEGTTGIVDLLGPLHEQTSDKLQNEEYAMYIGAALLSATFFGAVEPVPEEELAEDVALQFYGDTDAGSHVPQEKDLIEAFSDYWTHDGKDPELAAFRLRILMMADYAYGSYGADDVLAGVNMSIGGHGIQTLYTQEGGYEDAVGLYVNMGDAYATTMVYDNETFEYHLTSYADFLESLEEAREQARR